MSKGWISLHRSLLNHWIYEDAEYLKIWITFLLEATHKKQRKLVGNQSIELDVGQFVFGRKKFAERLKIKEWKLQKATELLVKDEMIKTVKRTNKYTIYEIVNYSFYQQQVQQQEMLINQGVSQIEHQQNNSKNDSKSNSKNNSNKARNIKAFTYFINSKDNNKATAKQQQELQQEQQQQSPKYQGFEAYEQQQEHQQVFEISTHNNNNNNNNNIYNAAANEVDSVISFYINSLSDYNPNNIQAIESYMDDMQPALVKKAIEIAVERDKRFFRYVRGILESWLSKGIKTLEEYEREELYKPQQQEENFGGPYVPNAEETRKMLDELLRGMKYESAAP